MLGFVIRRLLALIPLLLIVSFLVYALVLLVPGDPARNLLGLRATPQEVAQTLTLLRTAEAASTETMVRMLHVDWADEAVQAEVARIQAERGASVPEPAF